MSTELKYDFFFMRTGWRLWLSKWEWCAQGPELATSGLIPYFKKKKKPLFTLYSYEALTLTCSFSILCSPSLTCFGFSGQTISLRYAFRPSCPASALSLLLPVNDQLWQHSPSNCGQWASTQSAGHWGITFPSLWIGNKMKWAPWLPHLHSNESFQDPTQDGLSKGEPNSLKWILSRWERLELIGHVSRMGNSIEVELWGSGKGMSHVCGGVLLICSWWKETTKT